MKKEINNPCKNCLLKPLCVDACQGFVEFSKNNMIDDMGFSNSEIIVFKRLISAITKIPEKEEVELSL